MYEGTCTGKLAGRVQTRMDKSVHEHGFYIQRVLKTYQEFLEHRARWKRVSADRWE